MLLEYPSYEILHINIRQSHHISRMNLSLHLLVLLVQPILSFGFVPGISNTAYLFRDRLMLSTSSSLYSSSGDLDPATAKLLADAKQLLEKAKAKLSEEDSAKKAKVEGKGKEEKRASVTKQVMDDTGLITTDGDLMAAMSEEEEWSERSLLEIFTDETFDDEELVNEAMIQRDVAASINAMRVRMDNKDFEKIFDARNRFIGENR